MLFVEDVGPGSAEQRYRTMLCIAGRTLHRVRTHQAATAERYRSGAAALA